MFAPKRRQTAFTLIELLIVVIILTTLLSVVVPQLQSGSNDARDAAAIASVKSIQRKLDALYHLNGGWPERIEPSWFINRRYPRSPYAPDYPGQTFNTSIDPSHSHPRYKSTDGYAPYWYNNANGLIRIRVPPQHSERATLRLYNRINASGVENYYDRWE